ncbi:low-specificity L-threonine aldolase [Anaeropeptidivorans aminofermentans]|jgi:threonine aldolase|uniref:low-specificity L-threonine aldolase n=1 Tax=Anaeropeptidivorans aminofermentans TaxID=2934315 RepID=UPI0020257EE1|nr:low-specificity L-threonine aldolase [Anaeropeptidivorans aminofermentans]MBE6013650.1 low-specificity L-threonine aldolase [Lachnospiraceae bacterium]
MNKTINLMSDTTTLPTDEMRKAMFEAEVGDDVSNADPTIHKLQVLAANITGKEAALFMPSGTMGNLAALMSHCSAGEEVIVEENSHIVLYEGGGIARVAGLMPKIIKGEAGIMSPEQIKAAFREENIHFPKTKLICLENTHNAGGGTVYPMEYLKEIRAIADEKNIKVHMDGARVFNAAAYLNIDVKEIVQYVDSVMFCLSKGLSAPVGSMLCGTKEFIHEALRVRKLLGGGLRQSGVLAAAGIVSLEQMTERLSEDHKNARILAEELNKNPNISINMDNVKTNIVFFDVAGNIDACELSERLKNEFNILCDRKNATRIRMVTNRHIEKEDVLYVIESVNKILK